MEKLARTRLVTVGVLVVVFGSGFVLGMAMDRSLTAQPVAAAEVAGDAAAEDGSREEAPRGRDERRGRRLPMWEQVDPTADQRIRIDSIIEWQRESMESLHREFNAAYDPRYRALIVETREAIKRALTPEQAQAYDSLVAEFDRRRAERDRNDGE